MNRLLKERPNAIFLNAGDHYQGTLWYTVYRWNVTATFMNMLPHDAMVKITIYIYIYMWIIEGEKKEEKQNREFFPLLYQPR